MIEDRAGAPELTVWTHASWKEGTGHLRRMREMVESFRRNGIADKARVRFWVDGDTPVANGRELSDRVLEDLDGLKRKGILLIDLPRLESELIRRIRSRYPELFIVTFDQKLTSKPFQNLNIELVKPNAFRHPSLRELVGMDYAIIRRDLLPMRNRYRVRKHPEKILISFGGSDPHDRTSRVLRDLASLGLSAKFCYQVLLGKLYRHEEVLRSWLGTQRILKHVKIARDVSDMPRYMLEADFICCGGGGTLIEAMYLGIPACVLAQTPLEKEVQRFFVSRGAACEYPSGDMRSLQRFLHSTFAIRSRLSLRARVLVDGRGKERIVKRIMSEFKRINGWS